MMRLRRLFKKEEISWAALVLEVFSVTLSVLVAMAIGNWHEERQKQKGVEQALRGIEAELASNQRQMELRVSYYGSVIQAIDRRLATKDLEASTRPIEEWHGINPAQPSSASYQAAIATQAFSNMDLETATYIARIYATQDLYGVLMDKFLDASMAGKFREAPTLRGVVFEANFFTKDLVAGYEAVRGAIRKKLGEPMPVPPSQVSAKP